MCFDFTKMAPKIKVQTFFWRSCFYLVFFGQVRGNFGIWASQGKFGQKWFLKCFDFDALTKMAPVFFRSFSLEFFSGKVGEIWAKIIRTHKHLPAPTPMAARHVRQRDTKHTVVD